MSTTCRTRSIELEHYLLGDNAARADLDRDLRASTSLATRAVITLHPAEGDARGTSDATTVWTARSLVARGRHGDRPARDALTYVVHGQNPCLKQ